jgi:cysteine desulfurase
MSRLVYLDNNATTAVDSEVRDAMLPFLTDLYGNPSSIHDFGGQVRKYIENARNQLASLIGAKPEEMIFTSCGSESDNTAILSVLDVNPDKKHIITTEVEHPAILNLFEHLQKKGYQVTWLRVDKQGEIKLDQLRDAIKSDTAVISVMWANNETGVIFPVEEMAIIAKEHGILFHTDAVQAVGKIPINLKESAIDMLSLSGHKLHAPKGVGALYVRKGTKFSPYLIGGHQEKGRRAGTEAVPNIVALGKAAEIALRHFSYENTEVKRLRDKLEDFILNQIPHTHRNGAKDHRLPNTSNVGFQYVEGESILLLLSQAGICASSGSACTSGSLQPSHVLRAMAVNAESLHGSVRWSLSRYTTEDDIDYVIKELPDIIKTLRSLSPFWSDAVKKGIAKEY